MVDLQNIRQEYKKGALKKESLPKEPMAFFEKWLQEAIDAKVAEPTAVIVATVSPEGRPSMRCVLLKGVHEGTFIFYTNYQSRKGQHLAENDAISLTFIWHELERQVHIEGVVEKVPPEVSDAYFATRPYSSRVGARISHQSKPITGRLALMRAFVKESARWFGQEVQRPDYWGGYAVTPQRMEFWQGRASRLHDRFLYEKTDESHWSLERLSP